MGVPCCNISSQEADVGKSPGAQDQSLLHSPTWILDLHGTQRKMLSQKFLKQYHLSEETTWKNLCQLCNGQGVRI